MRKQLGILLLIGALVGLFVPQQLLASDIDDASDAHALGPYDIVSCNGNFEDELDTGDASKSSFPPFKFEAQEFHTNNGGIFSGGYEFALDDDEVKQHFNRELEEQVEPRVITTVTPSEVTEGAQVTVIAALADFMDANQSGSSQAAVAFSVNEVSLMGIMAGATSLPQSTGSACGLMTRTPHVDADQDGMDDDWEVLHGLNPADPGDASADPDKDSSSNFFTNADGFELVITPETPGGSSGSMTNLDEWTWGTDPKNSDTDGDNISDGEEIVGLGGSTVTFTNTFPIGSQFDVRAYGVGRSLMTDAFEERTPIVKLDASRVTIFTSSGEHLKGEALPELDFVQAGNTVRVVAKFVGTKGEPSAFAYKYEVEGIEVSNPLPSRQVLDIEIPETKLPGDIVPYEIQAVNKSTGQLARMRGQILVAEDILLESDPVELVAGGPLTVRALLASGNDPNHYLFEWRVNNQLEDQQSGIGRDSIALTAPESTGAELRVDLQIYQADNGQPIGQSSAVLSVASPVVELALVPQEPVNFETVTVIAKPKNFRLNLDTDGDDVFDATTLSYRWIVDGESLELDENAAGLSTVQLAAGEDGESHSISVNVASSGLSSESANNEVAFITLPAGLSVLEQISRPQNLLAAAVSAMPPVITYVGLGVTLLGITSVALVLVKRKRRTTKEEQT